VSLNYGVQHFPITALRFCQSSKSNSKAKTVCRKLIKRKPQVSPKMQQSYFSSKILVSVLAFCLLQHYQTHIPSSQEGPAYPGRHPQKFGFKQEPPLSHFLSQTAERKWRCLKF
jgi:hypothetical protein